VVSPARSVEGFRVSADAVENLLQARAKCD
jgi:hypothetical protein